MNNYVNKIHGYILKRPLSQSVLVPHNPTQICRTHTYEAHLPTSTTARCWQRGHIGISWDIQVSSKRSEYSQNTQTGISTPAFTWEHAVLVKNVTNRRWRHRKSRKVTLAALSSRLCSICTWIRCFVGKTDNFRKSPQRWDHTSVGWKQGHFTTTQSYVQGKLKLKQEKGVHILQLPNLNSTPL